MALFWACVYKVWIYRQPKFQSISGTLWKTHTHALKLHMKTLLFKLFCCQSWQQKVKSVHTGLVLLVPLKSAFHWGWSVCSRSLSCFSQIAYPKAVPIHPCIWTDCQMAQLFWCVSQSSLPGRAVCALPLPVFVDDSEHAEHFVSTWPLPGFQLLQVQSLPRATCFSLPFG